MRERTVSHVERYACSVVLNAGYAFVKACLVLPPLNRASSKFTSIDTQIIQLEQEYISAYPSQSQA